jgi:hypothetical protein
VFLDSVGLAWASKYLRGCLSFQACVEGFEIQQRYLRPADVVMDLWAFAVHMASLIGLCPARFQERDFGAGAHRITYSGQRDVLFCHLTKS